MGGVGGGVMESDAISFVGVEGQTEDAEARLRGPVS